ncbi:APH-domain-containing protein [Stemphylium lycopersici]|uniref:APH-domain-containing protein n=1 Tax=Stemphylium lycopersici TaxID=183478 RepID=A0A364NCL7_STELY|nr:aminoglycoside phosphotransferase [Stemphylium lycopersici]RAR08571.1 APH-domain-containing protein [Stemphylium lycopersici]RAR14947.1 APH-domain-containing protein [Stemphylium lycopersici]
MAGNVRQPIDIASLERLSVELEAEAGWDANAETQFGYGQSNPTYQLTDKDGKKYVLRKKPPGQLLSKTAHKVDREYRIIHALEKTDVPVPRALCLCQDEKVIGTDFYIMDFLDGRIFEDPAIPDVTPEERTQMWHSAITTLAKFHRVAPASVNLASYGKNSGFYNRQLATFNTICQSQASAKDKETGEPVGKIPHQDEMVEFFKNEKTQPKDRATFVHGDYKIDNVVFHKTEPRVIGILDWEMSTIGHPLSDLNNVLSPYVTASNETAMTIGRAHKGFQPGATPGLPTKEQLIAWYSEVAGWDPRPDFTWGDAFSTYRNTIIMQGIAARYALRQASSAQAQTYAKMMKPYAEIAWDLVQEYKRDHEKAKL